MAIKRVRSAKAKVTARELTLTVKGVTRFFIEELKRDGFTYSWQHKLWHKRAIAIELVPLQAKYQLKRGVKTGVLFDKVVDTVGRPIPPQQQEADERFQKMLNRLTPERRAKLAAQMERRAVKLREEEAEEDNPVQKAARGAAKQKAKDGKRIHKLSKQELHQVVEALAEKMGMTQ